jgi:hypothetical protein
VLVHINPAASDATSGLHQMRLRDAGDTWSEWQAYGTGTRWQLPAVTGQFHTVEIQIKDVAGNLSATYEDAILLDIYPDRPASKAIDWRAAPGAPPPKMGNPPPIGCAAPSGNPR